MLKADIKWSDLSVTPEWNGSSITMGRSRIIPYQHAALESVLIRTEGRWFAVVRERGAWAGADDLVGTLTVPAERYGELYRSCLLWPLDYVMVEVAQQGQRVKLRAGAIGSAPIYCRATDQSAIVSWDFADFVAPKLPIDFEVASCSLALRQAYSARQILSGVYLLTERATLFLERGRAQFKYPSPFEIPVPSAKPASTDTLQEFTRLLQRAIALRPMSPDRIAVELSGGMDSATVACGLATACGAIQSRGILVRGDVRSSQIDRRRAIVDRLKLLDRTADVATLPPSLDLQPTTRPRYINTEYYLEAFESIWGSAHKEGCDLMFTGLGGDELFMGSSGPDNSTAIRDRAIENRYRYARQLLTPRAVNAARSLQAFDAPAGPVPSVMASVSKTHHLMQLGIWPIHPLSNPDLMVFCYQLPQAHRQGRDTMRRYLRAELGEEIFPSNYKKETFAPVFPQLVAEQKKEIESQLQECALADLGLVNHRAALALLDEVALQRQAAPASPLINFLWLERFVRQLA